MRTLPASARRGLVLLFPALLNLFCAGLDRGRAALTVSGTGGHANAQLQRHITGCDEPTYDVLQQYDVDASGGYYAYSFGNIELGRSYLIVAGSDRDNDVYIDNPGETVGAYTSLDQITRVEVNGNLTGLDFASELKLTFSTADFSGEPNGPLPRFKRLR